MTRLLYSTFSSKEEAISVAHKLLAEKLVACANVLDNSTSVYNWEGATREENEAILFAKTSASNAEKAISRIKELHSYELPCILALPVEGGFSPFIDWVERETANP